MVAPSPLKRQIDETIDHLIEEHGLIQERQNDVDEVEADIKQLKEQMEELKTRRKDRIEKLQEAEKRSLALINELAMLRSGRPRLPNITPAMESDSADPADHHTIEELTRFGLTEKQIEKLRDSKLAEEKSINTIGDLIKAIAEDNWWHKKIKGWGETAVEKATDAITSYRAKHPAPDGDDRPKQCGACQHVYAQAIDGCPVCDSKTFELIDAPEPTEPTQQMLLGDEQELSEQSVELGADPDFVPALDMDESEFGDLEPANS